MKPGLFPEGKNIDSDRDLGSHDSEYKDYCLPGCDAV
jgi:hypothetical protein